MKKSTQISLILFFLILTALAWLGWRWYFFLSAPIIPVSSQAVDFVFPQGASVKTVAFKLEAAKIITEPELFIALAKIKGSDRNLKAGEYRIDPGITPVQLLDKMQKGDVINHEFTIIEGWTFRQVLAVLANNPYITHTLQNLSDDQIMSKIGHQGESPEGRFAPDTFVFSGAVSDADILNTSYLLMQKRLDAAWNNKAPDVPYHCIYMALIVASIIEKETAVPQEKPIVAGVILRRLQKNMLLQVDPTVIYGLGANYTKKLTTADLTTDSPYNTYTRKGLPPGPICMPSVSSINAALHPASGTELYYVAKGDGSHVFSNTLQEQDQAIRKYILKK